MNDSESPTPRPARGGVVRPPRPARPSAARPDLPEGVEPDLPRNVRRELHQHVRGRRLGDDVALALAVATDAVEEQDPEAALDHLEWAKSVAPRAPVIRETLAIARYLAGDFQGALTELRAYRRLSGTSDQDHLIADCLRATGRAATEVGEVVEALLASDVPADRRVEGLLVWAGAVADGGDPAAARAVLRRADRELLDAAGDEANERFTFVAGDLAQRAGDHDAAVTAFERLVALDGDPYGIAVRLATLRDEG